MMRGAYHNPGTKRGSDSTVSNGSAMSPSPNFQDNDAKKIRMDSRNPSGVSRVVHIRQIPNEVTEAEIVQMGLPFGKVVNVLVLKGKNQAFLEMNDEMSATTMVNYFQSCPANLRGRQVYVQFSNHKELKTDSNHPGATSLTGSLQAGQGLLGASFQGPNFQGGEKTVLRVIVDHMIYPVTLDVLNQIFSRAGQVLKIVTFTKLNTFQALIQFPDADTAHQAKMNLSGQNIYNGCCTLRIEDSKLTNLNVKFNNDKSRDYTNPNLPTGDPALDAHNNSGLNFGGMGGLGGMSQQGLIPLPSNLASSMGGMGGMQGGMMGAAAGMRLPGQTAMNCVLLVSNLNEELVSTDAIFTLFGVYGDVQRVKILYNKKDTALVQMAEPHQVQLAISHLDKVEVWDQQIRVTQSKHQNVQLPREDQSGAALTKDYSNSPLHRFKKPGSKNCQNIYPPSATLHLSNIPSEVEEEEIKEAFSETGATVEGFKFFAKDRKMALIQLGSVQEAIMALMKMHNHQLAERTYLRVSFSKSTI